MIPLKFWFVEEATRRQVSVRSVVSLFYLRGLHRRVVRRIFGLACVRKTLRLASTPRPGEVQLKCWIADEADRSGRSRSATLQRYCRNGFPDLKLRRVNKRVVFVKV